MARLVEFDIDLNDRAGVADWLADYFYTDDISFTERQVTTCIDAACP